MSWRWLDKSALLMLLGESLADHGGASGIRAEGLFDSALARPLNLLANGSPDYAELAAAYGVGLAKNPPFIDGNQRIAFIASALFLSLNGYRLKTSQVVAADTMLAVAAGEMDEATCAEWIRRSSEKRSPELPSIFRLPSGRFYAAHFS
jgi:death on curing protein